MSDDSEWKEASKHNAMFDDRNVLSSSEISDAIIVGIQNVCRGFLAREQLKKSFSDGFTANFVDEHAKPSNIVLLKYGSMIIGREEYRDKPQYLLPLCDKLVMSMQSNCKSKSFAALFLSTHFIRQSTALIGRLCRILAEKLAKIVLRKIAGVRLVNTAAHFLYTFSASEAWTFAASKAEIAPILETMCAKISTAVLADESTILAIAEVMNSGLKEKKSILSYETIDMLFAVVLRTFKRHEIAGASSSGDRCKTRLMCLHFLTCPALICALSVRASRLGLFIHIRDDNREGMHEHFPTVIEWLAQNQSALAGLSVTANLNLLANFVHLSYLEHEAIVEHFFDWTMVINAFLIKFQGQSTGNRRTVNNWHHPILGWTSERIDEGTQGTFGRVANQLDYLWNRRIVSCLFGKVLNSFTADQPPTTSKTGGDFGGFLADGTLPAEIVQKVLSKFSLRNQTMDGSRRPLPPVPMTAIVCQLYQNALITFSSTQIEILSGLCRDDSILLRLWHFINHENGGGLVGYISLLAADPTVSLPHFSPLHLFADTAYSLIAILDEREMYESDRPFSVAQLREIARFTNIFCFKVIWEGIIDLNQRRPAALFQSIYQLCTILHNRDCRRSFSLPLKDFWLVPNASFFANAATSDGSTAKRAQLIAEFERQLPRAKMLMAKMPHIVPLHDRMLLFRKFINQEKERMNAAHPSLLASFAPVAPATVITVERQRIVEDGYRQLASLRPEALRGVIRVKFINEQGLDEAGIDQDGVFKEFLELTLKKVFDPELNLFKMTSNRLLYPSSTSSLHENHLALFQFVGRMLAKAIFEGICVDVHLAPVLLATVLGKQLCPFDELATLDPVLYRNLTYVKHYQDSEDVHDLSLTFSYDEDFLGKVRTHELISGGQDIEVNNENKIVYIHRMAQFRVIKQTKEQCEHFVSGFRSILNPKWLALFSTHELQYLISGHARDIDLDDLRKHTQYYGGFHGNHRVIKWLWSILHGEFNAEERQLFLKFVTSCSRAPLLGFEYLEPPFSIRCVETSDDMDQGDTLGSIVRGFLAIKRKQPITRLPTASTCFNLLKLPNYSKRSILLEKLRYAIHAETGFELS